MGGKLTTSTLIILIGQLCTLWGALINNIPTSKDGGFDAVGYLIADGLGCLEYIKKKINMKIGFNLKQWKRLQKWRCLKFPYKTFIQSIW